MNFIRDLFSPVLSDRTIMKYNKKGLLIEQPIEMSQLQPNSVDLTLGNTCKIIKPNSKIMIDQDEWAHGNYEALIDPTEEIIYEEGTFDTSIAIRPKEFMLLASNEILNIPNGILCFVQGRSSIARIGLQTEQAGLIDAGFRGTITFELYNETNYNIMLYKGMRIAQVYFFKAEKANMIYGKDKGSKYSGQIVATGSRINLDKELQKFK